jgi:hypothetical protein
MINYLKNNPIKLILFLLIIFPILLHGLNKEAGFCYEKGKILSDEEIIKLVISAAFKNDIKLNLNETWIETYIKNQPECCRVYPKIGLINGFGSKKYKVVFLKYPLLEGQKKYFSPSSIVDGAQMYFVNECGLVVGGSGD